MVHPGLPLLSSFPFCLSQHDFPPECRPGGLHGNYIMFASATSGDRPNNSKFSKCSIGNISNVLDAIEDNKKRNCFTGKEATYFNVLLFIRRDSLKFEKKIYELCPLRQRPPVRFAATKSSRRAKNATAVTTTTSALTNAVTRGRCRNWIRLKTRRLKDAAENTGHNAGKGQLIIGSNMRARTHITGISSLLSHDSIVLLVVPVKDLVARAIRANSCHSRTTFNARPNRTAATIPPAMGNLPSVPLHCQGPIKQDATKELRYLCSLRSIARSYLPRFYNGTCFSSFERVAMYQRRVHWIDLSRMELDGVLFNEQHHS